MAQQKRTFLEMLERNRVVLVTGRTGCGKSTNIPSWIAQAYPNTKTLITQPRRMATENIAHRLCEVNGFTLTREVGFVMGRRYHESVTNRIVVATAGSAISVLFNDPDRYDYIILDEIHEQSPDIEQLIAITPKLQSTYFFKLILMSATVEINGLAEMFPGMAHFEMSPPAELEEMEVTDVEMADFGPHKVHHITKSDFLKVAQGELTSKVTEMILVNMAIQVARIVNNEVVPTYSGDILCFVPGIKQFQPLEEHIFHYLGQKQRRLVRISYIHSMFSQEFKKAVVNTAGSETVRDIIISTTICETSITLPSLSYVVDSCLMRYRDPQTDAMRTQFCSYQAILQRLGRVGRCSPGVYIPCIDVDLLNKLQECYQRQNPNDNIEQFILQYYRNTKMANMADVSQLLSHTSINFTELSKTIEQLYAQRYLIRHGANALLTPKGFIVSTMRGMFADAQFDYYLSFIQLPVTSCAINAVNKQAGLQIFIHKMEKEGGQNDGSYSVVEYVGLMHNGGSIDFQFNRHAFNEAYLFQLMAQNPECLQTQHFSEQYTMAKIVALWRQWFPVPTQDPTDEELEWCHRRLLSPTALREVELEIIQALLKLASIRLFDQTKLSRMDLRLISVHFPCQKTQIDSLMAELGYDHTTADRQMHQEFWKEANERLAYGNQSIIVQLLRDEEVYGRDMIIALQAVCAIAKNRYLTFIHSRSSQRMKDINIDNYPIYHKHSKQTSSQYAEQLATIRPRNIYGKPNKTNIEELQTQVFSQYCAANKLDQRAFKISMKAGNGTISSFAILPKNKNVRDTIQAVLCGMYWQKKSFGSQTLRIMDFAESYKKQKQSLQRYFDDSQPALPTAQAYYYHDNQNKTVNADGVKGESEDDIMIVIDEPLRDRIRHIKVNPVGSTQREQRETNCITYLIHNDMTAFTCGFFDGNVKMETTARNGVVVALLSYIMFQRICVQIDENGTADSFMFTDDKNQVLFGLSLAGAGQTDAPALFTLVCACALLSKHINQMMLQIVKKWQPLRLQCSTEAWPLYALVDDLKPHYFNNSVCDAVKGIVARNDDGMVRDVLLALLHKMEHYQPDQKTVQGFLGFYRSTACGDPRCYQMIGEFEPPID